jgi:hypothetical protein
MPAVITSLIQNAFSTIDRQICTDISVDQFREGWEPVLQMRLLKNLERSPLRKSGTRRSVRKNPDRPKGG